MEEIIDEAAGVVSRVAALDIGKASLVACLRVPYETRPGRRCQEVRVTALLQTTGGMVSASH